MCWRDRYELTSTSARFHCIVWLVVVNGVLEERYEYSPQNFNPSAHLPQAHLSCAASPLAHVFHATFFFFQEHRQLREMVRSFVEKDVDPQALEYNRSVSTRILHFSTHSSTVPVVSRSIEAAYTTSLLLLYYCTTAYSYSRVYVLQYSLYS